MLKKLQRKFVLLTTGNSIVVMLLIAVAINIINYLSIMNYADGILEILNSGDFGENTGMPPHPTTPKEFVFTTRFFVVRSNEDGEVYFIDTKNISSVSAEEAVIYVGKVNEVGKDAGIIDNFRFVKTENSLGNAYIFLDIEEDIMGFERYMIYSVLIVASAVVFIFILSCILSKKAVSPIAESYEKQKRFITDVSHEFNTPLSIIKADCDVIEIDNGEGEWTNSIKSQISRLNSLVESLISLTRLDEENLSLTKTEFSLSDALDDVLNDFSATIKKADLTLISETCGNVSYIGDETFIRKLFAILTENAIKYSKSYVKTALSVNGQKIVFTIENSCEDIKIGKHNNWFERFYRADESRNSKTKGFGIGLSIAKNICDKHGAKYLRRAKQAKK